MRVRKGFVSNSSSSSFILHSSEDKSVANNMFLSFLEEESDILASYLHDGYETDVESIKKRFRDTLFVERQDKDRLLCMLKSEIYKIVDLYVDLLIDRKCLKYVKDNYCFTCNDTDCEGCIYNYTINLERYQYLRSCKNGLHKVKFMSYFRELKERVNKAEVELHNNYPILSSYKFYENDIDTISTELAEAWVLTNPDAAILEFYSDNHDHTEAVLRFLMYRFTKYCRKRGVKCLYVDYS